MKQLASIAFIVLSACAAQPKPEAEPTSPASEAPAATPAEATAAGGTGSIAIADKPFTAEEIRAATPKGRSYEFKLQSAGREPVVHRISFTEVTADQAVTESVNLDETGTPVGDVQKGHASWAELAAHASYPRDQTVISNASIETPAGKFDCKLYTVSNGDQVSRIYFARDLPGAPVMLMVEEGGQVIQTMTLLRHVAGG